MSGINGKNSLQNYRASIGNFDGGKVGREARELKALEKAIMRGQVSMSNSRQAPLTCAQIAVGALAVSAIGLALLPNASAMPVRNDAQSGFNPHSGLSDHNYGVFKNSLYPHPRDCLHTSSVSTYKWRYLRRTDDCNTKNKCPFAVEAKYQDRTHTAMVKGKTVPGRATVECPRDSKHLPWALYHVNSATISLSGEPKRPVRGTNGVDLRVLIMPREIQDFISKYRVDGQKSISNEQISAHFIAVSVNDPSKTVTIKKVEYNRRGNYFDVFLNDIGDVDTSSGLYVLPKSLYDNYAQQHDLV